MDVIDVGASKQSPIVSAELAVLVKNNWSGQPFPGQLRARDDLIDERLGSRLVCFPRFEISQIRVTNRTVPEEHISGRLCHEREGRLAR
jgi:hypothetical protein